MWAICAASSGRRLSRRSAGPGTACAPTARPAWRTEPDPDGDPVLRSRLSVVLAMPAALRVLARARSGARPAPLTLSPSWFAGTLAGAVDLEQHDNWSDQLPCRRQPPGPPGAVGAACLIDASTVCPRAGR